MAGLCRNPCHLVSLPTSLTPHSSPLLSSSSSPASASPSSSSFSSSSTSSCPPILCSSRRSKKRAAKVKSLPPSTRQQQQASRKVERDSDSDDILLGIGAGASTITALQPRADHDEDDDPAWQQREQLRLRIAQQRLLRSYKSSPGLSMPSESDPLSRYASAGYETSSDTSNNEKQLALADEEEALDVKNGGADENEEELEEEEEELEGEHLQYEWAEVNAEDEDYEDENEEDGQEEYVEFWQGDLGPMTEEEEAELLLQAEMELAELEKEKKARKSTSPISHQVEETDSEEDCSDEEALLLQEADAELAKFESSSKQLNDRNLAQTIRTATSPRSLFPIATEAEQQEATDTKEPQQLDETEDEEPQQLDDTEDEDAFIARVTKEIEAEEQRKGKVLDDGERSQRRAIPAVMRCFDRAKIFVKAGNGGNGVVAFRREKYVPFGGPSGGSGGRGGHVYVEADASMNSLLSFRKSVHFRAGRGAHGQGKSQDGAAGEDCTVKVPLGTVIREADNELSGSGKILLELTRPGQVELLLPGGRGGRGNAAFKTGRNKTPQLAENGEEGAEMWLELELKLVADVGIIGIPNAGKSTLLSAISAAQPAIANYPFTTLLPNLGVVSMGFEATMVFADLPGLLEGAHLGIGLGHEFLRHTERCRVLVHMVDGMSQQPEQEYEAVRLELELFNPSLSEKPFIVAFNKMDIPEVAERWEKFQSYMKERGIEPLCISAATKKGTPEVVNRAYAMLQSLPSPSAVIPEDEDLQVGEKVRRQRSAPIEQFEIVGDSKARTWEVRGVGLERFVQMTNWEYFEALTRFQHVLTASGINKALKAQGVSEGDTVIVGEMEFEWHDSENVLAGDWRRGFRGSRLWPH